MSNARRTRLQTSKVFLLSSLSTEERKAYGRIIEQLGGICFDTEASESFKASCTHLICGKLSRSEKFLGACATGKWILKPQYLLDCRERKEWLPEDDYEWHPAGNADQLDPLIYAPSRCRLQFALSGEPAFKGWKVSVSVSDINRALVYKRLLRSGGANLFSLKLPVENPVKIANAITYIFADNDMAVQLMEQHLMEYGVLLLKPEFIGDYLIRDPHPDPMDYIVSLDSPNNTPNQEGIRTSQDSIRTSQNGCNGSSQVSNESTSQKSQRLITSTQKSQSLPESSKNRDTSKIPSESLKVELPETLNGNKPTRSSSRLSGIGVSTICQEATQPKRSALREVEMNVSVKPLKSQPVARKSLTNVINNPSAGNHDNLLETNSNDSETLVSSQRSTRSNSKVPTERVPVSSSCSKPLKVNDSDDDHFISFASNHGNLLDTNTKNSVTLVSSQRSTGSNSKIPSKQVPISSSCSKPIKVEDSDDDHFISLETSSVKSNDSSSQGRRISRRLAGSAPSDSQLSSRTRQKSGPSNNRKIKLEKTDEFCSTKTGSSATSTAAQAQNSGPSSERKVKFEKTEGQDDVDLTKTIPSSANITAQALKSFTKSGQKDTENDKGATLFQNKDTLNRTESQDLDDFEIVETASVCSTTSNSSRMRRSSRISVKNDNSARETETFGTEVKDLKSFSQTKRVSRRIAGDVPETVQLVNDTQREDGKRNVAGRSQVGQCDKLPSIKMEQTSQLVKIESFQKNPPFSDKGNCQDFSNTQTSLKSEDIKEENSISSSQNSCKSDLKDVIVLLSDCGEPDSTNSRPVTRKRSGSLVQVRRRSKKDFKEHSSNSQILSRSSTPVNKSLSNSQNSRKSEGTPLKPLRICTPVSSPSLSQGNRPKLSQSSLRAFGFSSANKKVPKFSQQSSQASLCTQSPGVSQSQGSRGLCTDPKEEFKACEFSTLAATRDEAMDITACIHSSEKKRDIGENGSEVEQSKSETPTNITAMQSCAAKRKIFDDCEEDLRPIAKKIKVTHPLKSWRPGPLTPAADTVTTVKDQDTSCTTIRWLPNSMCSLIQSCVEEDFQQEALALLPSLSNKCPSPQILNTVMCQILLKAKSSHVAQTVYKILMNCLSAHPPTNKLVKEVYTNAFTLQEDTVHESVLDLIAVIIEGSRDEDAACQERHSLVLQYLVSVFRHNFNTFLQEFASGPESDSRRKLLRSCMLLQCLWYPSYTMFPNARTQQLLDFLEQALLLPPHCRYKTRIMENMLALVSMAAQCCHLTDNKHMTSNQGSHQELGERTSLFVNGVAAKIAGSCIKEESVLLTTLRNLQPDWLCLKVCQILLGKLDDYLLLTSPETGRITLTKIVSQYFFLLPRLSPLGQNNDERIKIETPKKSGRSSRSRSSKTEPVETKDAIPSNKINKKNHLGETALHMACIKNDVPRLKQLLQVPDVDVNIQDNAGWTALHEACNKGHVDCVELLLKWLPVSTVDSYFKTDGKKRRVDMLATNAEGVTPLHDAVANNRLEVCRLLLRYGGTNLLLAQTKLGLYPKDLATTPGMCSVLTTSPTPVKDRGDDLISSQESVTSTDHNRSGLVPSAIGYDQVLDQNGRCLRASLSDCCQYISLVNYLLQSYLRSSNFLASTGVASISSAIQKPFKSSKENKVPSRSGRRIRKPVRLSEYVCGKGFTDSSTDAENQEFGSTSPVKTDVGQSIEEDRKVLRRLKYHLRNFSLHISKITKPEDFEILQSRLSLLKICTMAAAKLDF